MIHSRPLVIAACLLLVLSGSGCWDREELENLGLVLALGIDSMPNNRVEVTAQVAIPVRMGGGGPSGMGGGQGPATQMVTETAPSIPEAFRAINRTVNRRITLAQNRLVIFGDGTAKKGLGRFLALITRYREFRRTMQIMIVKGRAKDVMNLKPELEKNPAEYLMDLGRLSRYTGETDLVSINDFVKDMERFGSSPHATYLLPPSKQEKNKKTLKIGGVAVFRGDRMVGVYGPNEVNAFLILARRFTENFQSLPDPTVPKRRIVLHFTSAKARIKPYLRQNQAALSIQVLAEADLVGTETGLDYTDRSFTNKIERAAAGLLEDQMRRSIRRAKEDFRSDPFSFGEYFRLLMPSWSAWRAFHWHSRFPETPVSIHVRVHMRRFGFQRQAPVPVF